MYKTVAGELPTMRLSRREDRPDRAERTCTDHGVKGTRPRGSAPYLDPRITHLDLPDSKRESRSRGVPSGGLSGTV